jgi:CHASE2 domain-containing sensor protein
VITDPSPVGDPKSPPPEPIASEEPAHPSGAQNGKGLLERLRHKTPRHWVAVFALLFLTILAAPQIYAHFDLAQKWRIGVFQWLYSFGARPSLPTHVTVVLIKDSDYWLGEPGGRRPLNRNYLAKLVDALDTADAQLIALDFDMRLPDPDGKDIPEALRAETDRLIGAIVNAAEHRKVVLSRSIWLDPNGHYRFDQDIYQPYGICAGLSDGHWMNPGTTRIPINTTAADNISCGYIALVDDQLILPGAITIGENNKDHLDSFSLAVARANDPILAGRLDARARYATYIAPELFDYFKVVLPASELLAATAPGKAISARSKFAHRSVIVGADWCRYAFNRCPGIDVHPTPVGILTGALLHASYAEAVLDSRTLGVARPWLPTALELLYGLIAVLVLSLVETPLAKLAAVVSLFVALPVAQLLSIHFVGMYFEAIIPLIGLTLHTIFDHALA